MKTRVADEAGRVLLLVAARRHFRGSLERGDITKGPVPDDRPLGLQRINPEAMNLIKKGRCAPAGLEAREFSAPGQRS
jgi:hypothetical protein